jgi:hypothetical protein
MKKHLEKLRSKPEEHKQKIVKTLAFVTTGIIVVIYIIILSTRGTSDTVSENIELQEERSSFFETFETTFEGIGSSVNDLTDQFKKEQESLTELLETAEQEEVQNIDTETEINIDPEGESLLDTEKQN